MDPSTLSSQSHTSAPPSLALQADSPRTVDRLAASYDLLRQVARGRLGRTGTQTLSATDLVHEAIARIAHGGARVGPVEDDHLVALAAQAMRNVLVDRARAREAVKRGGGRRAVDIEEAAPLGSDRDSEVLAVNDALAALGLVDARAAKVVELRYFGGLTEAEAGAALGVTERTVRRDWRFARAWLLREVGGGEA